jgi:hypothetical protein
LFLRARAPGFLVKSGQGEVKEVWPVEPVCTQDMGAIFAIPLVCLGSCAASCATTILCKLLTCNCLASPFVTNVIYCVLLLVATIAALVFRYTEQDLSVCLFRCDDGTNVPWVPIDSASYMLCEGGKCQGQWAVFRISFALFSLFVVLLLLASCKSRFSVFVHRGFWMVKIFGSALVLVGCLFAPNDMFAYYAWVARFLAPAFLVYQVVSFIDFGYTMNNSMIERDDAVPPGRLACFSNPDGNAWKKLNLFLCAVIYSGVLAAWILLYRFFPMSSCSFNPMAVTTTLLFVLSTTVISISKIAPHGALLTSGLVSAYTTYLCYGAMAAMPFAACNPSLASEGVGTGAVSICIATFTVAYLSFTAGRRETNRMNAQERAPGAGGVGAGAAADNVTVKVAGEETPHRMDVVEPQGYWHYYLVMVLMSIYMAMMLTNWGTSTTIAAPTSNGTAAQATEDQMEPGAYNASLASAWIQMATGWVCSMLYLWTLIAPKLCPNRDFG